MKKSFWVLMVVAVLVVVFSVQNAGSVNFSFFIWQGDISLAILLIIAFILGAIVGAIYYGLAMRAKSKIKQANDFADIPFVIEKDRIGDDEF